MTRAELQKKYPPSVCRKLRTQFDEDVQRWSKIKHQGDLDVQCISTGSDDPSDVAGPWPEAEWRARHTKGQERPCLHENILVQYLNQVVNQIELNPMGVEVQPAGDGSDKDTAEFLEGRIRQWEYENNGSLAYLGAAREAATRSYGFWKNEVYYRDTWDQKVCIESIVDPDSGVPGFWKKPDASDLRRFWELEWMTDAEYIERFGAITKYKTEQGGFANEVYAADIGDRWGQWAKPGLKQVVALWHFDTDDRELLRVKSGDVEADVYSDEIDEKSMPEGTSIISRRKTRKKTVLKTIFNGCEALDETEYIDPGVISEKTGMQVEPPEIPVYIVTGRQKFEKGERTLESLVRNGRIGNLVYDYIISTVQQTIAITGKPVRMGPEGTFDTSTNWDPRDITAYKEYKPVLGPDGAVLPPPIFELYEPPIQAIELAKASTLIGIQNAIGMSSAERKDRAAKSGKALDQLQEELSVGTSHYFASLRVAQERQYRAMERILPILEKDHEGDVAVRDRVGKHRMTPANYTGRHAVTIGTGKAYQNLESKQEDFAQTLAKISDPTVLMAALPGICRMAGIGAYGQQMAEIFEAILIQAHPELEPIINKDGQQQPLPPQAMQQMQQMQQAAQAMNAKIEELETKVIELEDERRAEVAKLQSEEKRNSQDNETKILVAQINAQAKEETERIKGEIAGLKTIVDSFGQDKKLNHEANENEASREHEAALTLHESAESDKERQHETELTAAQLAAQKKAE